MTLIVVNFKDCMKDPAGARAGAQPSRGIPDCWIDALIGTGSVFQRDHAAPDAVSTVSAQFPSPAHAEQEQEQFCLSVKEVANLLGTNAHIHKIPPDQTLKTLLERRRDATDIV